MPISIFCCLHLLADSNSAMSSFGEDGRFLCIIGCCCLYVSVGFLPVSDLNCYFSLFGKQQLKWLCLFMGAQDGV